MYEKATHAWLWSERGDKHNARIRRALGNLKAPAPKQPIRTLPEHTEDSTRDETDKRMTKSVYSLGIVHRARD